MEGEDVGRKEVNKDCGEGEHAAAAKKQSKEQIHGAEAAEAVKREEGRLG